MFVFWTLWSRRWATRIDDTAILQTKCHTPKTSDWPHLIIWWWYKSFFQMTKEKGSNSHKLKANRNYYIALKHSKWISINLDRNNHYRLYRVYNDLEWLHALVLEISYKTDTVGSFKVGDNPVYGENDQCQILSLYAYSLVYSRRAINSNSNINTIPI